MNLRPDATASSTCPSCGEVFVHLVTRRRVWCSTECRDDALGRIPRHDDEPPVVLDVLAAVEPDDEDQDNDESRVCTGRDSPPSGNWWPASEWFR